MNISHVQDSNSIPPSPHLPKVHNIHIRREGDLQPHQQPHQPQPARPRSAMSTTTICSETSVDFEVQNILGNKHRSNKAGQGARAGGDSNESQEIIIDFDSSLSGVSSANNSFLLNNSHVINGVKRSQTFNNRKNLDIHDNFHGSKGYYDKSVLARAHSMTRSSAERSLDELSLYDQMCDPGTQPSPRRHPQKKKDPRVEDYRNLVLAEIKSKVPGAGPLPRSLSESDLSDLGGGLSPGPADTETDTELGAGREQGGGGTLKRREVQHVPGARSRSSPGAGAEQSSAGTPSSGYSELTSSSGN